MFHQFKTFGLLDGRTTFVAFNSKVFCVRFDHSFWERRLYFKAELQLMTIHICLSSFIIQFGYQTVGWKVVGSRPHLIEFFFRKATFLASFVVCSSDWLPFPKFEINSFSFCNCLLIVLINTSKVSFWRSLPHSCWSISRESRRPFAETSKKSLLVCLEPAGLVMKRKN